MWFYLVLTLTKNEYVFSVWYMLSPNRGSSMVSKLSTICAYMGVSMSLRVSSMFWVYATD